MSGPRFRVRRETCALAWPQTTCWTVEPAVDPHGNHFRTQREAMTWVDWLMTRTHDLAPRTWYYHPETPHAH